jgi:hypothetical protein
VPHEEVSQWEHLKEIDDDLRRDRNADRVARSRQMPPLRWLVGYLVVLVGAAGFVAGCFLPFYGIGRLGRGWSMSLRRGCLRWRSAIGSKP